MKKIRMTDPLKVLDRMAQVIYDKKGFNIIAIDVRGVSNMTDFFIVAEGNVERHVMSLYVAIHETMLGEGETPLSVDGLRSSEWIVVDYGTFIVHLFIPELREKYEIEQVWKEGSIVDLNIKTAVNMI